MTAWRRRGNRDPSSIPSRTRAGKRSGSDAVGQRWWRRGRVPASWELGRGQPHARFAGRAAELRAHPRRMAGAVLAAVLLLAGAVYLVGFSPALVAREVRVEGLSDTLGSRVHEQAQVPLGEPLARIDTGAVAERVSRIGLLDEVEVSRSWPSGIAITATPKVPVVAVENSEGELEVAAADGELYATVQRLPDDVQLVQLVDANPDEAADDEATAHQLRQAVQVVQTLEIMPDRTVGRLEDLEVRGRETVQFTLGSASVVWGSGRESEPKAEVLQVLLDQQDVADAEVVIDVTAPTSPVVTTAE